jgi:hypothetical protein
MVLCQNPIMTLEYSKATPEPKREKELNCFQKQNKQKGEGSKELKDVRNMGDFFFFFMVLGIDPRALCWLSKHSITELCPKPYRGRLG